MNLINLTPAQLRKAANLKEQVGNLHKQLASIIGAGISAPSKPAKPVKGKMSAAGRARIVAAQKLRWAKINAAKAKSAAKPVKKGKSSAAGIARIKAAQKARWAKINAAKSIPAKPARKFTMSASAKARISAAAKARWAKIRAAKAKKK